MNKNEEKTNAALAAVALVENGMILGIGSGSTAEIFIRALAEKVSSGWSLAGVPTSARSEALSIEAGVKIVQPDETTTIDLAVDGADEVDDALNLIKGGGGALLREKIVASAARRFVVIADHSKQVTTLGAFPLPVEIESFGWALTVRQLRSALSASGREHAQLRLRKTNGQPTVTDNGNLIVDCSLERIDDPSALEKEINFLPGVIDCGLFCNIADTVILAKGDNVITLSAKP